MDDEPGNDAHRSGLVHHYPSANSILEGKKLVSTQVLPPRQNRVLMSVIDLNAGEELFTCGDHRGDSEPDLAKLVDNDSHPLLLLHWIVLDECA